MAGEFSMEGFDLTLRIEERKTWWHLFIKINQVNSTIDSPRVFFIDDLYFEHWVGSHKVVNSTIHIATSKINKIYEKFDIDVLFGESQKDVVLSEIIYTDKKDMATRITQQPS